MNENPFFYDGKLDQELLFSEIAKSSIIKYSDDEKAIYVYNGTHYVIISDFIIVKRAKDLVGGGLVKPFHVKELLDRIKHEHSDRCFPDLTANEKGLLNLKNGVLDIKTGKLLPHSPDQVFVYCSSINYDPEATCPKFMKFLNKVMLSDQDLIALIQEMFGACLLPGNAYQKAFLFLGVGRNGKSTLSYLLKKMLGDENVSCLSPSQFSDKFKIGMIRNKLANISDEAPAKVTINAEIFKNLTSGGDISAEEKNKPAFTFVNVAKIIFSCNGTPRFDDHTLGLERRPIVIPFDYIFKEDQVILSYEKRLEKELPGILNFSLAGLKRLQKNNGNFTIGKASAKAKEDLLQDSDPVREFLSECTIKANARAVVEKDSLYKSYREYCQENGHHACSKGEFSKRLKNAYRNIKEFRETTDGRDLFWKGYDITLHDGQVLSKDINDLNNDSAMVNYSSKKLKGLEDFD